MSASLSMLAAATASGDFLTTLFPVLADYALLLTPVKGLVLAVVVMSMAGLSVLAERKICAWIQRRHGPNRAVVPFLAPIPGINFIRRLGLFQLAADGGKFLFKEEPVPGHVRKFYYVLAPIVALIPPVTLVALLPFGQWTHEGVTHPLVLANLDIGYLFILALSSLGVYGMILAGWGSNSKYPFLGSMRASAQMLSYELALGLSLLPIFMWAAGKGSEGLNLFNIASAQIGGSDWALWNIAWQPLSALIFLIAIFAETNRLPFDMPESETDLVAGFNTEYGAFKFGLFFVAEYMHVVIGSAVFSILFLGGWSIPFVDYTTLGLWAAPLSVLAILVKTIAMIVFFIFIRWTLPRFRSDQIMNLGWRVLMPVAIANLLLNAVIIGLWDTLRK